MAIAARPSGKTIRRDFVLCRSSVRALLSWEQSSFAQRRLLRRTSAGHPSRGSRAHRMPLQALRRLHSWRRKVEACLQEQEVRMMLGAPIGIQPRRWFSAASVHHGHDGSVGKDDRKLRSFPRRRSHMAPRTLICFALVLATVFLSISTARIEWRRWLSSCSRWACVALPRIVHRRAARVALLPEDDFNIFVSVTCTSCTNGSIRLAGRPRCARDGEAADTPRTRPRNVRGTVAERRCHGSPAYAARRCQ